MRYVLVAIICLAVGFGAGWLAFHGPPAANGGGSSDATGHQLLRDLRQSGMHDADSAACTRVQASANYRCTVVFGLTGDTADRANTYIVRPDHSYIERP